MEIIMIQVENSYILGAYAVSGGLLMLLSLLSLTSLRAAKRRLARLEAESHHDA